MSDAVAIEMIRTVPSIAAVIGAMIAALFGYLGLRQGQKNHEQGERNYKQMNGRMEQMLSLRGEASEAHGIEIGEKKEQDRQALDKDVEQLKPQHPPQAGISPVGSAS